MLNSFIDLINESMGLPLNQAGLVDEMGVKRPERLTGSQMGTIRQSTIDLAAQRVQRPQTRDFNEILIEIKRALKSIRRLDITMEKLSGTRYYYPKFPQAIVDLMQEAKAADSTRFKNEIGKWRDVYPTDNESIHFRIDAPSDNQRSHFPNGGIPTGLRGIGLGYKLYRTLLKYAGYLSSNRSGTPEKDKAWGSLLAYKANPDGTPSEDDAHAIIGPSNWMALDKGLATQEKIDAAMRFIDRTVGFSYTKPDAFDMDDELIAIMPEPFMSKLHDRYLRSLLEEGRISQEKFNSIESSRAEAERLERERREREEAAERERQAQAEAETRRRLASRLQKFGADPDADWNVGDFVVVKNYLYDPNYDSLPIRRVVGMIDNSYVAAKVRDAMRIDNGDIGINDAPDARTTTRKMDWVKVNIDQIPDLNDVNLTDSEITYIQGLMDPAVIARVRAEREEAERQRLEAEREANAARAQARDTFGNFPESGRDLKDDMTVRPQLARIDLIKAFKTADFYSNLGFIVLGQPQRDMMRGQFGIPVFIPWMGNPRRPQPVQDPADLNRAADLGIYLTNPVNGFTINPPFVGLNLTAYPLVEVTVDDKINARGGDLFYIAGHKNVFGVLAKSDYGAVNTASQKFIYMKVYGGAERSVSVRLDLLRKIGAPITL